MDRTQLQEHLLRHLSLRVGDEMADYITRRLSTSGPMPVPIPIIAHCARTGLPRALSLSPSDLRSPTGNSQLATRN